MYIVSWLLVCTCFREGESIIGFRVEKDDNETNTKEKKWTVQNSQKINCSSKNSLMINCSSNQH